MATVDKNFKVKHGLVVEGTTATVNGDNIVTENASQTLTNKATPNLAINDGNGNGGAIYGEGNNVSLAADNTLYLNTNNGDIVLQPDGVAKIYNDEIATKSYVDGQVPDNTDGLSEGTTNKYYSTSKAKTDAASLLTGATLTNITITGNGSGLTITAENGVADSTTTDLAEGTNLYFTDERAQDAVGLNVGTGLSYNDASGVISVTADTYDAYGAAGAVASDLSDHISDSSTHGVTGNIVGTSDTQTLTNKTIGDGGVLFNDGTTQYGNIHNDGGNNLVIDGSNNDVILTSDSGYAYIGTNGSPATRIATQSYVDGLASGLNVKNSVKVAVSSYADLAAVIDGYTLSTGDRVLALANDQNDGGIYVATVTSGSVTFARSEDQQTPTVGDFVFVEYGTYGRQGWIITSILNGYQIWSQFSAAGEYTAGTGITFTGTEISVNTDTIASKSYVDNNFVQTADLPPQITDYVSNTVLGQPDGVATLDGSGYVPLAQLGNVPTAYITSVGANLSVNDGELDLTTSPGFDVVTINSVAQQIATVNNDMSAGVSGIVARINPDVYRSGKFLVKVSNGTDTEVSEILLTTDSSNNIAITEYGIVGTNGTLSAISASYQGGQILLQVTPVAISNVVVFGTLF